MNALDLFLILTVLVCIFWADAVVRAVDWTAAWLQVSRRCGWCKKRLGGNPFAKVSDGICETCRDSLLEEIRDQHDDEYVAELHNGN